MKKALLLSIRPQWLAKILNGEKSVEIRKRVPKWVFDEIAKGDCVDVYCYCTKKPDLLIDHRAHDKAFLEVYGQSLGENKFSCFNTPTYGDLFGEIINGLVPCKFTLKEVDEIERKSSWATSFRRVHEENTCLTYFELLDYVGNNKYFYALYITGLEIFDKPMELREFYRYTSPYGSDSIVWNMEYVKTTPYISKETADFIKVDGLKALEHYRLTKAPQSMQTVYVDE